METVLITGGCGYIGSHIVLECSKYYNVIIIDNFSNSYESVYPILKKKSVNKVNLINVDLCDFNSLYSKFDFLKNSKIKCVIHMAAKKYVKESVDDPLLYYCNNINSLNNLLSLMSLIECNYLIFSSSCTVYGNTSDVPIKETHELTSSSPYGFTKVTNEQILMNYCTFNSNFKCISLRYFNPLGSHKDLKENPKYEYPQNLMPNLLQAIDDPEYVFSIFGNTYNTHDGTPVRDYIHVVDLADAHRCALENIESLECNYETFNVGTGIGYSVMDVIRTMEAVSGTNISRQLCEPREGDVECVYADTTKIGTMFDWCANKTLVDMCQDSLS